MGKFLVGTFVTGGEFCSSPNAFIDYSRLRKAVAAFGEYPQGFCIEPPVEYMKLVSGHDSDDSKWSEISSSLGIVLKLEDIPNPEVTRKVYADYDNEVTLSNKPFLDAVAEHREQIKYKGRHKRRMNEVETRLEHKEFTKNILTSVVGGLQLDWKALDLFLCTFDEWFRQLSIQPSLTMKINDWDDLLNLVYVGPSCLYWTEDYKKTREFIVSSGCGHYLYQSA